MADQRDPGRVDIRQPAQVRHRHVEVALQRRGGGFGAGRGVRQRPRVGAVPREIQQDHDVAARRQRVAELGHQPRRTREPVRDHHAGPPRPGRVHLVERHCVDRRVPVAGRPARPGQQPPAGAGRQHDEHHRRDQPSVIEHARPYRKPWPG
jgi:hypothetical protein